MAQGFVQVDLIVLCTLKCTLVELIAEFIIITKITNNSNTLYCSVFDAEVQADTKQHAHSTARMKMFILCYEH